MSDIPGIQRPVNIDDRSTVGIAFRNVYDNLFYLREKTKAVGVSGTVTLVKLTGGGSNGSITFTDGVITGFVEPT